MGNSFILTAEEEQKRQSRERSKRKFLKLYKQAEDSQKEKIFNKLRRLSLEDAPRNASELHKYYQVVFGYTIPFTSCSEDMCAPFEWICDSYFAKFTQSLTIAPRGGGKGLPLPTKIPTPTGFKLMGELVVGDEVYDSKGNVCKVTFVTETMYDHKCYDIVFDDGTTITADGEHQWYSWTKKVRANNRDHEKRRNKHGIRENDKRIKPDYLPEVLDTDAMSLSLGYGLKRNGHHHNGTQERNHAIKTCVPISGNSYELPIDPYILGFWLGDGTTVNGNITTADLEILDIIEAHGYTTNKLSDTYGYNIVGLYSELEKLGVRGEKFIPIIYLRASSEDRFELLRGLMDSDGSIKKSGSLNYSSTKQRLALDVRELINSLGIKCGFTHRVARLYKRVVSEDFRLSFQTNVPIFKLPRKLELQEKYNKYREVNKYRYVVSITECESVPVRCIQVDSPDASYLCTESFVITHNTSIAAADAYTKCKFRPNYSIIHVASNLSQSDVAKEYLSGFSNDPLLRSHLLSDPTKKEARWKNNSKWAIKTGSMSGVSGQHPNELKIDEIEFAEWSMLEQSFAVPLDKDGHTKQWSGFSTRQRSFGCLPYYTRITTEDGPMKIGRLVSTKYSGKVLSYNYETKQNEWKKVTGWFRNGSSTKWLDVRLRDIGLGRGAELICTDNHLIPDEFGNKRPMSDFVVGDKILVNSWIPSKEQEQILIGGMLGDACIDMGSFRMEHSNKQLEYLTYKSLTMLDNYGGTTLNHKRQHTLIYSKAQPYLYAMYHDWYPVDKKIVFREDAEKLDVLGFAIWCMDDGCFDLRKWNIRQKRFHLYTNGFAKEDVEYLIDLIHRKFGILGCLASTYRKDYDKTYYYIKFSNTATTQIETLLTEYIDFTVHLGKRNGYKRWIHNKVLEQGTQGAVPIEITVIHQKITAPIGKYDICVEDNHNYYNGSGCLVSNSMSRLTSQIEAGLKDIKMYKWSCFETMQRCATCVAIDEHPHGNDESRQQSCALWKYCHGQKGIKATGWISRKDVIEMSKTLSDEGFETQFLCLRPSSHGLTCHNFIHEKISNNDVNAGNYADWTYDKSLPLFGMHDPAEGNKSVFVFFQIFNGLIFVFDEIILDPCFTTGEMKKEVYKRCTDMGYPLNLLVLVDPHRQDAMKEWREGSYSGEGNGRSFNAEIPNLLEYEEIDPGLELLRRYIKAAHGERRLFINNKKCPGVVLAVKENHYNVDKHNNILQGAKQAKPFKDEIDVLRYLVIYVEKTYAGGGTTGSLS